MRSLGFKLVTLLLIVEMAMPAMSFPALRHSHANGDRSHRHDVATHDRHGHSHANGFRHSKGSRHRHHSESTTAKRSHEHRSIQFAQPPFEHLHVFWLGFEFSMPLSVPERPDSPRPIATTEQWVPLISEVTLAEASQVGSQNLVFDRLTPTELTPRLPARSEVVPPRELAVTLLCDTARRARSGVLVI